MGTLSSNKERFLPWRTIEGEELAPSTLTQLEVLIRGVFEPRRFLDLLRYFVVFEGDDGGVIKKLAGYHQFHAVGRAVEATVAASRPSGRPPRGRGLAHAGLGQEPDDGLLRGPRGAAPGDAEPDAGGAHRPQRPRRAALRDLLALRRALRQSPEQAEGRAHLRELLQVASGGVVFTTIQKFCPETRGDTFPLLSERANIVVIADEAHRSQYDFIDGFARHMRDALPNASFIGFTGTPIAAADKNTRAVFGEYISVYDIQRAVADGATVPIYYESRLAKLQLREEERPRLDEAFDEVTEGEELEGKEKLKSKWSALEALVGTERRLQLIATTSSSTSRRARGAWTARRWSSA
jgi:type I restriction enzyme R subunit